MKSMKSKISVASGILIISLLSLLIIFADQLSVQGKEIRSYTTASQLARDLVGTWVLVGTPDQITDPPLEGARLKFCTGKHWMITQADPKTGLVIYHHGGTYTIDKDEYVERVKYANNNTRQLINRSFKFKIKVEGDTYTQIGIGNP